VTLAPLLEAPPPIIEHHPAFTFAAIGLGAVQLALMLLVAGKLALHPHDSNLGTLDPIHLLLLFTLGVVPLTVLQARRHNVAAHRSAMIWIFTVALVVTDLFTLAPGRIMNKVMFSG
jgi:uncharacterized membrane protein